MGPPCVTHFCTKAKRGTKCGCGCAAEDAAVESRGGKGGGRAAERRDACAGWGVTRPAPGPAAHAKSTVEDAKVSERA